MPKQQQIDQLKEAYRIWRATRLIISKNESAIIETILFNWVSSFIDMTSVSELNEPNSQ